MRTWVGTAVLAASAVAGNWNVREFGALGDRRTDDTGAFQRALDGASEAGGGVVDVPAGHYWFSGVLRIPGGVTLQGTFRAPANEHREGRPDLDGSVLLVTAGRGTPESAAFVTLAGSMATLQGVTITYPQWREQDIPPVPYPPAVQAGYVANVAVLDCFFLHTYEAIHFQDAFRFLVRNVYGYPSHRGLYVDNCLDVGRVENCHFWPFGVYRFESPYRRWIRENGVAFEFARSDWQYVLNTFCFGYGVGYKFSRSVNGSCNGNFVGIGADSCRRAVLVEDCQPFGLLITNGEFVGSWGTQDSVAVEVAASTGNGKVSLSNCAIWGPLDRCVRQRSAMAQLTLIGCNLCSWDAGGVGSPAVHVSAGAAIVQGNTFTDGGLELAVDEGVTSVIAMGNQAADGFSVTNHAGAALQAIANQPDPFGWTPQRLASYRLDIGHGRDDVFLKGWGGPEKAYEWGGEGTKRWSGPASVLRLPVLPGVAYVLTFDVHVPEYALAPDAGVYVGKRRLTALPAVPGQATIRAPVPAELTKGGRLTVRLACKSWVPAEEVDGSADRRALGVAVREVSVTAADAAGPVYDPLATGR